MAVDKGRRYSIIPQFETADVKVDLVELDPRAKEIGIKPGTASLLVALHGAKIQIDSNGKSIRTLDEGTVSWLDAGSDETLSNASKRPSGFLQINFKDTGTNPKP
jgi:hypothetical protein